MLSAPTRLVCSFLASLFYVQRSFSSPLVAQHTSQSRSLATPSDRLTFKDLSELIWHQVASADTASTPRVYSKCTH